jgi:hypothetical protein
VTDGPFKSMTPDPSGLPRSLRHLEAFGEMFRHLKTVKCDRCGGFYSEGDWPWCRGAVSDHRRDS